MHWYTGVLRKQSLLGVKVLSAIWKPFEATIAMFYGSHKNIKRTTEVTLGMDIGA